MIEVGEYVRTEKGDINKVIGIREERRNGKRVYSHKAYYLDSKKGSLTEAFIVKHSKNIIDLIEVGDYVNGEKIEQITTDSGYKKYYTTGFGVYDEYDNESVIHSILTKEQMEANQYVVK